jgi:hypothetical protein
MSFLSVTREQRRHNQQSNVQSKGKGFFPLPFLLRLQGVIVIILIPDHPFSHADDRNKQCQEHGCPCTVFLVVQMGRDRVPGGVHYVPGAPDRIGVH